MSAFTTILIRSAIFCAIYFILTLYVSKGIKTAFKKNPKKAVKIYTIICYSILIAGVYAILCMGTFQGGMARFNLYLLGLFAAVLFFNLVFAIVLFIEDIPRIVIWLSKLFTRNTHTESSAKKLIPRRTFISKAAFVLAAIPFTSLIYGMVKGKYNLQVRKETIYFDDLPLAFDGLTITQFSDLHIGSFDFFAKGFLEHTVNTIQELNSDLILFTGDIVNSRATEMDGWYDVFNHLNAPLGKYSILGNHDYGDYVNWPTDADKEKNLQDVKNIHPQLGFQLLLNEHVAIKKDTDTIFLVGVENWGNMSSFPKYGDIKKATEGLSADAFKILMSHDPSYWDAKLLHEEHICQLTLSGHTHGFQMGVEIPGLHWSPSQYFYKEWVGLYASNKNQIYVNRGLGTVGYPGRAGIWPEITQLTLKKKNISVNA